MDLLYPPVCPLCGRLLTGRTRRSASACRAELAPRYEWRCDRCGAAGVGAAPENGRSCRLCPPSGASYQGVLSVAGYGERVARCVHLFKYHGRLEMGRLMGVLMVERLAAPLGILGRRIDLIAPVPLHWCRRLRRGFSQSGRLAAALGAGTGVGVDPCLLRRIRYTRAQALVPRERRADNVRGAFSLRRGAPVRGRGILLVDDVVTSGHTIDECARMLRLGGAREVWVASFARAGMGRGLQPGD
ncbi:MAG: ComF family protein [bacterium]|nr:ComF family protein [bacterium]